MPEATTGDMHAATPAAAFTADKPSVVELNSTAEAGSTVEVASMAEADSTVADAVKADRMCENSDGWQRYAAGRSSFGHVLYPAVPFLLECRVAQALR